MPKKRPLGIVVLDKHLCAVEKADSESVEGKISKARTFSVSAADENGKIIRKLPRPSATLWPC
jgi:hypothetical protein